MSSDDGFTLTSTSTTSLLNQAAQAESIGDLMKQGVGGFVLGVIVALMRGVSAWGDLIALPISSGAEGLATTIGAITRSPGTVIEAAADQTAAAFLTTWSMGPLTFPAGVGVVLFALYLIAWYRGEGDTSNVFPGIPYDVPWGSDEDG